MAEQGKQGVITIVAILMMFAIFGVPVAEKIAQITIGQTIFDLTWMGGFSDWIGQYIFGFQGDTQASFDNFNLTPYALLIIFLMIWLIIFVTFGDILEAFSSFDPSISWIMAFCLAVIGGMTGAYGGWVGTVTHWFVNFGASAVYLGLGASFLFFILIETGLGFLIPHFKEIALKRKLGQQEIKVKSKAIGAANTIEALDEISKKLQKP